MALEPQAGSVRVAELVATLSYAADLGLGQPMEHRMRQTVIAQRLAELVGANAGEREATYHLGLLTNVYCHADAAEQAKWFGDDITFKSRFDMLEMTTAQMASANLRQVGSHGGRIERAKRLMAFPLAGQKLMATFLDTHSRLGSQFAERIGLDDAVCLAVRQAYEQWDGKGHPGHLRGEQICLPTRLVQLAGRGLRTSPGRRGCTDHGLPASGDAIRPGRVGPVLRACVRTAGRPR